MKSKQSMKLRSEAALKLLFNTSKLNFNDISEPALEKLLLLLLTIELEPPWGSGLSPPIVGPPKKSQAGVSNRTDRFKSARSSDDSKIASGVSVVGQETSVSEEL